MRAESERESSASAATDVPMWQRWLPRIGTVGATITTFCCLGVAAALSLASAVGATFLTRDATLKPLLIATLTLTVIGSALTYGRHRNPIPLLLTALSGIWVYSFIFVITGTAKPVVWAGLATLIGVQIWDVFLVRKCQSPQATSGGRRAPR